MSILVNTHEYIADIRWGEMDALGHLNNVAFLSYFETARVECIRALGYTPDKSDLNIVLVQVNLSYHSPVVYPAKVRLQTNVSRVGNSSATFQQQMLCAESGTRYAECEAVAVWVDKTDGRPRPVPDGVRQRVGSR